MKTATTLTALLIAFSLSAQVKILNRSLTDSTLKIAYIGLNNSIELADLGSYRSLKVTTSSGILMKINNEKYTLKIQSPEAFNLTVEKDGQIVLKETFKGEYIGKVFAWPGLLKDSVLSVEQILQDPYLKVEFSNSFYKHNSKVISFNTHIYKNKVSSGVIQATGESYTQEQIYAIKQLKKGDELEFRDIIITAPNGRTVKLNSFYVKIK